MLDVAICDASNCSAPLLQVVTSVGGRGCVVVGHSLVWSDWT